MNEHKRLSLEDALNIVRDTNDSDEAKAMAAAEEAWESLDDLDKLVMVEAGVSVVGRQIIPLVLAQLVKDGIVPLANMERLADAFSPVVQMLGTLHDTLHTLEGVEERHRKMQEDVERMGGRDKVVELFEAARGRADREPSAGGRGSGPEMEISYDEAIRLANMDFGTAQ